MNNIYKFYVICPPRYETGGVELLHQITAELSLYSNINAKILYNNYDPSPHSKNYEEKYHNRFLIMDESINFDNSTIIFPEIFVKTSFNPQFNKTNKIIFWESVDNYFFYGNKNTLLQLPDSVLHLAQSAYAEDFLKNEMHFKRVMRVSDYLNDDFLLINHLEKIPNKIPNTICYNPAKGLEFTKKIIEALPDINFIPLKGLTRAQMIDTLSSSMLYIDFGSHPGKDRLPREAAMCGCCILVGLIGAALYREDIPIPPFYKVNFDVEEISKRIYKILNNYDGYIRDFTYYRQVIKNEKNIFKIQVKNMIEEILK